MLGWTYRLVTTSTTLYLEVEGLKTVPVPLAALVYTTEPLWGAAFAYLFLGDRWGAKGWVGAALILGSSVGSQLTKVDNKDLLPSFLNKKATKAD